MHPSSKGDRRPCQCLLQLESWSEQWLLSFNTEKCKVLKLGEVDNGQYFLHDNNKQTELLCCENEKDLGVWIVQPKNC